MRKPTSRACTPGWSVPLIVSRTVFGTMTQFVPVASTRLISAPMRKPNAPIAPAFVAVAVVVEIEHARQQHPRFHREDVAVAAAADVEEILHAPARAPLRG